jgi:hypothetical protein
MTDTEPYWEAVPCIVNGRPQWDLFKHHTKDGKKYRDRYARFETLNEVQAAIDHIETAPVRFAAKGAA